VNENRGTSAAASPCNKNKDAEKQEPLHVQCASKCRLEMQNREKRPFFSCRTASSCEADTVPKKYLTACAKTVTKTEEIGINLSHTAPVCCILIETCWWKQGG
jgi:hypothetical protein